jgi:Phage ABA sandwich domain
MNDVDLVAGREMDVLVAEKVMGIRSCTCCHGATCPTHDCPRYSINIAAAWEVVEKSGGKFIALRRRADNRGWTVIMRKDDISDLTEEASADTAPLAICRAALKVVEENS